MRRTGVIAFCVVCSAPIAQAQSLTADESEEIPPKGALQTLVSEAPDHPRSLMASITTLLFCIGIVACAHEAFLKRKVSERFIVQIALPLWAFSPFQVSPDSKRVAYVAQLGKKWFVVVDGKEEKQYDEIVMKGGQGARIIFETPVSLHYLAVKAHGEGERQQSIYLVEESIE